MVNKNAYIHILAYKNIVPLLAHPVD